MRNRCTHWVLLKNEQIDGKGKQTLRCSSLLVATKLLDIAANNLDAKESVRCNRVFVVTELIASGTQCNIPDFSRSHFPSVSEYSRRFC